jgi:DnaA family protein
MSGRVNMQLTLGLSLKDDATFDNFYPGENAEIVAGLKKTAVGLGERIIYLCGARGQGRSHLLQAACHEAHQLNLRSVYLPLANLQTFSPDLFVGLESLALVCIDDLQSVAGSREWEEGLFHFYNNLRDAGGSLIMSANALPKTLPFVLPDLMSRMSWGIVYQLHSLSDEEKLAALMMRAHRRGMSLSDEVGRFMLTHCPRHMGTLFAALDALDNASLAAQRRLTIPFVKEVLEI